jgi:hypothetical protein
MARFPQLSNEDRLVIPRGHCPRCGAVHTGFLLQYRKLCDCGSFLVMDFPYSVIFGYIRHNDSPPCRSVSEADVVTRGREAV